MSTERLALVTGTSSGIGAAVAERLLAGGWRVLGAARRTPKIAHRRYRHLALDLADVAGASAVLEHEIGRELAERPWQRLGLVNNAAVGLATRFENLKAAELQRVYALNSVMPHWLMAFVAKRRPASTELRVVNISSGAAVRALPGLSAYCASKAALRMAGMAIAAEEPAGVAVFSYEPGVVDTDMQLATRSRPREEFPWVDMFVRFHESGMLAPPQAPAAEVVAFLDSPAAAHFKEARRA